MVAGRRRHHGHEVFPQGGGTQSTTRRQARSSSRRHRRSRPERSARQVIHRLAGCWRHWGETRLLRLGRGRPGVLRRAGLHACRPDGRPELARNGSTPGSPGPTASTGPPRATTTSIPPTGQVTEVPTPTRARSRTPASSRASNDDLVDEGGIMDLWVREARLFKYGSGTGTNFSQIRGEGEKLSGGGTSSRPDELPRGRRPRRGRDKSRRHHAARGEDGLPRHRPPGDRGLHQLEGREEKKVAALVAGRATRSTSTARPTTPYRGQNSNNSVRVTDDFMKRSSSDGDWQTTRRTDGEVYEDRSRRATSGPDRRGRVGLRRSRACSTTRRSTSGTPARTPGGSTRRTRAPSTCSSTTRRATCAPQPHQVLRRRGRAAFDVEGYRHAIRVLDDRARDQRADGAASRARRSRGTRYDYRTARPRLREPRHAADAAGHPLRLGRGPRRSPAR